MEILPATIEHLDDIIRLNKIDDYGNSDCFIQESISHGCVIIAVEKNTIIGFSLYQVIWGNTALLALLKVHPEYQRMGIGAKLVSKTESKLLADGFNSLTSSTEEKNDISRKFHTALGFTQTGILDLPHGKEIFYRKSL